MNGREGGVKNRAASKQCDCLLFQLKEGTQDKGEGNESLGYPEGVTSQFRAAQKPSKWTSARDRTREENISSRFEKEGRGREDGYFSIERG